MPKSRIVGDAYQPYLCLSNAHDGSSSLQVFLTGVRVVCNNTLQAALKTAKRKISIRHLGIMTQRQDDAIRTMGAASKYFHDLETFAESKMARFLDGDDVMNRAQDIILELAA
jgi:hypothetical protein